MFGQYVNGVSDHEAVQLEQVFCSFKMVLKGYIPK